MDDNNPDIKRDKAEDNTQVNPLSCGLPLENAGVATEAESELLKNACSADLKRELKRKESRPLTNSAMPADTPDIPREAQADLWQNKTGPDERAEWNSSRTNK